MTETPHHPDAIDALPPGLRSPIASACDAVVAADREYRSALTDSFEASVAIGRVIVDARRHLAPREFARWLGALEMDPRHADLCEDAAGDLEDDLTPFGRPLPELRLLVLSEESTSERFGNAVEAQSRVRLRLGSAINRLRTLYDSATVDAVTRAIEARVGQDTYLVSACLARQFGDENGIVPEGSWD